jgi:hypothetical protein
MIDQAAETLRQAGIINPRRVVNLIQDAIAALELDLSGMVVLTEAASGPYVVTPAIAALAGAKTVFALTRDSQYASADAVTDQTRALEVLCGISEDKIQIYRERSPHLFAQADIVTNLGFVRPLDAETVATMKPTAVVPLMCEAWEFREGDVDLEACRQKGIPVLGTNEDYPGLEVFAYSGWLCLKMLFAAQIEVHKSNILVVSNDKFGRVIERLLARAGARVQLLGDLRQTTGQQLAGVDALVIADYTRESQIIGERGDLTPAELARMAAAVTVLQFAGRVDVKGLKEQGIVVYPGIELDHLRMGITLAELGPRPVVELHAAGLRVGQMAIQAQRRPYPSPADNFQNLAVPVTKPPSAEGEAG